MVGIKNGASSGDIEHFVGAFAPWDGDDPVDEVSRHREFRRHRRHPPQLSQLAQRPLFNDLRQRFLPDQRLEVGEIIAVVLPQLLMNDAELLLQVELALILEHRAAHIVVDLSLEAQQLDFSRQQLGQHLQQASQGVHFEQ